MLKKQKTQCPICQKDCDTSLLDFLPFCSKKCQDIDLHHWLDGKYFIADDTQMIVESDDD